MKEFLFILLAVSIVSNSGVSIKNIEETVEETVEETAEETAEETVEEITEETVEERSFKNNQFNKLAMKKGVDISSYQKNVNFEELDVDFLIIRMFDGWNLNYQTKKVEIDKYFLKNVEGCVRNNIPFGIYIYTRATSEEMSEIEAELVASILQQYDIKPDLPVFYDVESQDTQPFKSDNGCVDSISFIENSPEIILRNYRAFKSKLGEFDLEAGIYSNDNTFCYLDKDGENFADDYIWIASFQNEGNSFESPILNQLNYKEADIYQFSSNVYIDGIDSYVDANLTSSNFLEKFE